MELLGTRNKEDIFGAEEVTLEPSPSIKKGLNKLLMKSWELGPYTMSPEIENKSGWEDGDAKKKSNKKKRRCNSKRPTQARREKTIGDKSKNK